VPDKKYFLYFRGIMGEDDMSSVHLTALKLSGI